MSHSRKNAGWWARACRLAPSPDPSCSALSQPTDFCHPLPCACLESPVQGVGAPPAKGTPDPALKQRLCVRDRDRQTDGQTSRPQSLQPPQREGPETKRKSARQRAKQWQGCPSGSSAVCLSFPPDPIPWAALGESHRGQGSRGAGKRVPRRADRDMSRKGSVAGFQGCGMRQQMGRGGASPGVGTGEKGAKF